MDPTFIVVIVGIATTLMIGRHLAARRVAAGDGRFAMVIFAPALLSGAFIVWGSIRIITNEPVLGLAMTGAATVYLAGTIWAIIRSTRGVNRARTRDEITDAITEPTTELMILWMSLILIGGLIAVVALIAWGVSRAAG
jgi:hypothetical protein